MFLNYFALGVLIFVFWFCFTESSPFTIFPITWLKNATILMLMPFIRRVGLACLHSMQFGRSCGFGPRSTSLNVGGACNHTSCRTERTQTPRLPHWQSASPSWKKDWMGRRKQITPPFRRFNHGFVDCPDLRGICLGHL